MSDSRDKKKKSVDFSIKAAWLAISKMYNYIGADFDITHSSGFVLLNIDREKGTPATKIAPLLGMEARSLTRMLKSIEEKGLIYRKSDKNDKRKVIIFLTEEGKKKRELARQSVKYFNRKLSNQISEGELQSFFKVIEKIHYVIENLDEHEAEEEILGNIKY
ncbi:MAG: MarR family transcriptional regulator [Bacteroidota bacterium]